MNEATQRYAPGGQHPSAVSRVLESWRALRLRHAAAALVVALVSMLFTINFALTRPDGLADYFPAFVLRCALSGATLVLAVTAADHFVDHGAGRLRTYALAAAAAAIVASVVSWHLVQGLGWGNWFSAGESMALQRTQMAFEAINGLVYNALGTAAYVHWRDSREALRLLRASELHRAQDARRLQQTRLLSLQAHVDPDLLFAALRRVGALQRVNAGAADTLLTELIALLRGLMPTGRAAASTVAQEVALALSYLRVVASASTALTIETSIAPDAGDARLDPMLLLPLLKAAIAAHAGRLPRLQLHADTGPGQLRIALVAGADASFAANSPELARLRERLAELHGTNAALVIESGPRLKATLHLPLEHDDRSDR